MLKFIHSLIEALFTVILCIITPLPHYSPKSPSILFFLNKKKKSQSSRNTNQKKSSSPATDNCLHTRPKWTEIASHPCHNIFQTAKVDSSNVLTVLHYLFMPAVTVCAQLFRLWSHYFSLSAEVGQLIQRQKANIILVLSAAS